MNVPQDSLLDPLDVPPSDAPLMTLISTLNRLKVPERLSQPVIDYVLAQGGSVLLRSSGDTQDFVVGGRRSAANSGFSDTGLDALSEIGSSLSSGATLGGDAEEAWKLEPDGVSSPSGSLPILISTIDSRAFIEEIPGGDASFRGGLP